MPLVRLRAGRLDDGRLAELAASGDERAFEVVYDRHHRPLLAFCRHMLGSREEAEDALQQTFLRAHRALLGQGAPDELRPWLFAIARNRCLTILAARKAEAVPVEDMEAATDGLSAGVEQRADLRALLGDIARLPEDQRAALVLAEIGDLSHAEIAEVIEVPTAKVKALVHQARSRLIADREARETSCSDVRELLSTARGGELRRGPLRRHLAVCDGCRAYRHAVAEQRSALALVLPVTASAGLKDAIFGALGGGGGAGAVASGGAAGGAALSSGGTTAGLAAKGLGAKLAIGAALAGGAGGGAVIVDQVATTPARPVAAAAQDGTGRPAPAERSAPATPPRGGAPAVTPVGGDRASETGKARREAAAQRRRARAERRPLLKRQRADAREQARQERAAEKQARVEQREQRAADRNAAQERRTAARVERLAVRPRRGTSGTRRPARTRTAPGVRAPERAARTETPVKTIKPQATPVPTAVPTPTVVAEQGKNDAAQDRVDELIP